MFKFAELTEVMRAQGDHDFFDLLNKIRIDDIDETVQEQLEQRFIQKLHKNYPADTLHMFDENQSATFHSKNILNSLEGALYQVNAIGKIPDNSKYVVK